MRHCNSFRTLGETLGVVALIVGVALSAANAAETSTTATDTSALTRMNNEFRQIYAAQRARFRRAETPTIVAVNDKIILIKDGQKKEFVFVPEKWSVLKDADHIPLALFVLLQDKVDKPLSVDTKAELGKYKSLVEGAKGEMFSLQWGPDAAKSTIALVNDSLSFIDEVLKSGAVSRERLTAFARAEAANALENAYQAEVLELSRLDAQMQSWHKQLTDDEWKRLHVIIIGAHMPRQEERRVQYFTALLGDPTEGHRIIYQEGNDDVDKALDLLATHELDASIGAAFFCDAERMHRDLLADAAKKYLSEHPPQQ